MKKRELVDLVAERSGVKKTDAKKAVETALEILREQLVAGQDVQLPPLGKLKVKTRGEGAEANTIYRLILQKEGETTEA